MQQTRQMADSYIIVKNSLAWIDGMITKLWNFGLFIITPEDTTNSSESSSAADGFICPSKWTCRFKAVFWIAAGIVLSLQIAQF